MIRKLAAVTALTIGLTMAGITPATARPVPDTPVECGPGMRPLGGHCVQKVRYNTGPMRPAL